MPKSEKWTLWQQEMYQKMKIEETLLPSLCWGLTTHQPLWVILCRLPEKRRRDRRDSRGDEREGQGRKSKMNESEETEETRNVSI